MADPAAGRPRFWQTILARAAAVPETERRVLPADGSAQGAGVMTEATTEDQRRLLREAALQYAAAIPEAARRAAFLLYALRLGVLALEDVDAAPRGTAPPSPAPAPPACRRSPPAR